MNAKVKKVLTIVVVVIAVLGVAWYVYHRYQVNQELKHPKFYSGNGRLEATEVYVSSKLAGRIDNIFVKEGDLVRKGDKLVQMETDSLIAERNRIIAQIENCKAEVQKKQSTLDFAKYKYDQQKKLLSTNATAEQKEKEAKTAYLNAVAELASAKANVNIQQAELEKTNVDIKDSLLIAKYDGRIQNLLAHEGEVLSAGGRVMNIIALTDVYMTFFLPTNIAGKVKIGAEVKLVFDAAPDFPIDAKVTFVDPVAQFTPKSVETQVEREKLMFRVKASIDPKLLEKHLELVKTGIPGVAWVKLAPDSKWEECPVKINLNPQAPPAIKEDLEKNKSKNADPNKKNPPAPAEKTK